VLSTERSILLCITSVCGRWLANARAFARKRLKAGHQRSLAGAIAEFVHHFVAENLNPKGSRPRLIPRMW